MSAEDLEPAGTVSPTLWIRRSAKRSRQNQVILLIMLLCLGVTAMVVSGIYLHVEAARRNRYEQDLATLQGTWQEYKGFRVLVIQGNRFEILPEPLLFSGAYGIFSLDVTTAPKTIDMLWQGDSAQVHRDVYNYTLTEDRLTMRGVSYTGRDGQRVQWPTDRVLIWGRPSNEGQESP